MDEERRADLELAEIRVRLERLVENRSFRFKATSRSDADAFLRAKREFQGAEEAAVAARERTLGGRFPVVFRRYLIVMGQKAGDLFCGSDIGLRAHAELRTGASSLLEDENPPAILPETAEVFLMHQGYSFRFVLAEGGYDGPVFAFVEGDGAPTHEFPSFLALLRAELDAMEANNRTGHKQGGHYVTVQGDGVSMEFPALADGLRPLDGPDLFLD